MLKAISLTSREFFDTTFSPEKQKILGNVVEIDFPSLDEIRELSEEEFCERLSHYDIMLGGWGARCLPDEYQPKENQYFVMITGSVTHNLKECHMQRGLRVSNWGDAISQYIAESALMQLLTSIRAVGLHYHETHINKAWVHSRPDSQSLFDRNVGLYGFGLIAQKLVPLLRPFNVTIKTFDPYIPQDIVDEFGVTRVDSLAELFKSCDVISVHAAKSEETNDTINAEILALLPDHGVLANTARGNCIDEEALAAEHRNGRLWSALDVFKQEPLPEDHPLRAEPRCIIMCHQGGPTKDGYFKMGNRATENILHYAKGEDLIQELKSHQLARMT